MKKIIFILLLAPVLTMAQKDSIIAYTGVVEIPGASRDQLFTRARQWFNETFASSKEVLQIADKETGELAGKGFMRVIAVYKYMGTHRASVISDFVCNVWVKDGKYKYELSDFDAAYEKLDGGKSIGFGILTSSAETDVKWPMVGKKTVNEMYRSAKVAVAAESELIIASLQSAMSKPAKGDF